MRERLLPQQLQNDKAALAVMLTGRYLQLPVQTLVQFRCSWSRRFNPQLLQVNPVVARVIPPRNWKPQPLSQAQTRVQHSPVADETNSRNILSSVLPYQCGDNITSLARDHNHFADARPS